MNQVRETRIQTICLMVLTAVAISAGLYFLKQVMIPFVLAAFLTLTISPVVRFFQTRCRMPRYLALLLVLICSLVFLGLLWWLVSISFTQLAGSVDRYQSNYQETLDKFCHYIGADSASVKSTISSLLNSDNMKIGTIMVSLMKSVMDIVSKGAIVLIFMMFMLAGSGQGKSAKSAGSEIMGQVTGSVQRYLGTKLFTSVTTGLLVGLTLWIIGVDLAVVFGLLVFILNFIPAIGGIVATILPIPLAVMSPEVSATGVVLAVIIPGSIQFAVGNIIEPKMLGKSLDLHPVTILLALIFWGFLWGIIGMLLATPITALLKMVLSRWELTAPLAELMAGNLSGVKKQEKKHG